MKEYENIQKNYQLILRKKRIQTARQFDLIIRKDLKKIVYSLYELKNISTLDILSRFFGQNVIQPVMKTILGNARHRLHHIGFEIYEPMDLVIDIFKQRMNKFNEGSNHPIKVLKIHRFPASKAFQARVNAYSEIMRLWIQLYHSTFMLELFDIHRPVQLHKSDYNLTTDKPMIAHLLNPEKKIIPKQHLISNQGVFKQDAIWHYAIHVNSQDIVRQLHVFFQKLVVHAPDYKLAFTSIVTNANDGSFLTKIINARQGIELEFIAQEDL